MHVPGKASIVVHAFHPSCEMQAGHPQLQSNFEASLGYTRLSQTNKTPKEAKFGLNLPCCGHKGRQNGTACKVGAEAVPSQGFNSLKDLGVALSAVFLQEG